MRDGRISGLRWFVCSVTLLTLGGCQGGGNVKDYIPPDQLARTALTTALDGWKSGRTSGLIAGGTQTVELQDYVQREGRKLSAYEIVGPAAPPPGDENLHYTVKLTFEGATAPEEFVYVVQGKDPLWVYNEKDYKQLSGTGNVQ